jgi:hypothetical protein
MVEETWASRDLPVLKAAVRTFEELAPEQVPEGADIAEAAGFDIADVTKALIALDGDYLDVGKVAGDGGAWYIRRVHSKARRAIGTWPDPQQVVDEMITAVDAAAEDASDPETKSRLKQAAGVLGGVARDVVTKTLAEVVARQVGA